MKVLVATDKPFAKVAVDGIRREIEAAGSNSFCWRNMAKKPKLLEAVKDANAIIIRSDIIDAQVLDAAKELKIVVRAGAGYDNVDLEAATAHNVCVMNTPDRTRMLWPSWLSACMLMLSVTSITVLPVRN